MTQQLTEGSHSLIEIPRNDWTSLLEIYSEKKRDPAGYSTIKNYINWMEQNPELGIKCYSLDGDWKTDGTYIIIVENLGNKKHVHFNTLSNNLVRLSTALCCLRIENTPYNLFDYEERLVPVIDAVTRKYTTTQTVKAVWYTASKELVEQFSTEPPDGIKLLKQPGTQQAKNLSNSFPQNGITLRNLEINEAPIINDLWPHRSENSLDFLQRLINYNISVGAYDAKGQLIGWCLRLPMGSLGVLQVLPSHRRLGLGGLLVRYLSKRISELGEEVLAPVVSENAPSRKMFEKLGFQQIDYIYWTNLLN